MNQYEKNICSDFLYTTPYYWLDAQISPFHISDLDHLASTGDPPREVDGNDGRRDHPKSQLFSPRVLSQMFLNLDELLSNQEAMAPK